MVTPTRAQIVTHGIDELTVSQRVRAGLSQPEVSARLFEEILRGAALPAKVTQPFSNKVEISTGEIDLDVLHRGNGDLDLKAFFQPESLHRAPQLAWRQLDLVLDAFDEVLWAPGAEREPVRLNSIALHADITRVRIHPGTIKSFKPGPRLTIKPQYDDSGEFTGFDVWERRNGARGKAKRRLFARIYRKDVDIRTAHHKAYIREFWPSGLAEPVWRIEFVFQRTHLRAAGLRDLLPESIQRAWEWALTERVQWVRGAIKSPIPLWRALPELVFEMPWTAATPTPTLPPRKVMSDDVVLRRSLGQGISSLAKSAARAQEPLPTDAHKAIHAALDAALAREPRLSESFEASLESETRRLALPRLRRTQVLADGTEITWTTTTPADAEWADVMPRGICD